MQKYKHGKDITRKLMLALLGEELLKNMTPTGKSTINCIPKPVYTAVFGMHFHFNFHFNVI